MGLPGQEHVLRMWLQEVLHSKRTSGTTVLMNSESSGLRSGVQARDEELVQISSELFRIDPMKRRDGSKALSGGSKPVLLGLEGLGSGSLTPLVFVLSQSSSPPPS